MRVLIFVSVLVILMCMGVLIATIVAAINRQRRQDNASAPGPRHDSPDTPPSGKNG